MNTMPSSSQIEESRIREAYRKRQDTTLYSCFNPAQLFFVQGREREILGLLRKKGIESLAEKRILEVGCGTGHWIRQFINWGARPQNITGVDLLSDRVAEAKQLCPDSVRIECGSAACLGFADAAFDLVLQSTVFSSVLDPSMKRQIAAEMLRVVKGDGLILWYDFHVNNPRNPDVRGVKKNRKIFSSFQIAGLNFAGSL